MTPAELQAAFAVAMDRCGPFEPDPALTAAVSGGADSLALAVLAQRWTHDHGGHLRAVVIDHALRPNSAEEARLTLQRLDAIGIPAAAIRLSGLQHGSALAERARILRYQALTESCRQSGSLHLLLGHHAADQAETMAMRVLRNSQTHGLAAMPMVSEQRDVRLLRPLLAIPPADLRGLLRARGVAWVEDPSNRDLKALRPRLRHRLAPHLESALPALTCAARNAGRRRAEDELRAAAELATEATIRPEGFAVLSGRPISPLALAALIRCIGGSFYAPNPAHLARLAARPEPTTLAGVRILPAGRMGAGFLLVREAAAMAPPVVARPGAVWDGRFRLVGPDPMPDTVLVGALGAAASGFRKSSALPAAILRTLPALRLGKTLVAVPHLGYGVENTWLRTALLFDPRRPAAGACFRPT